MLSQRFHGSTLNLEWASQHNATTRSAQQAKALSSHPDAPTWVTS